MDRFDPKQPSEAYYLGFNFEGDFTDDDGTVYDAVGTVSSVTAVDAATGTDVSADMIDAAETQISGNMVRVWVLGGVDGSTYQITVVVVGQSLSEVFELDALLPVAEV